MLNTFTFDLEIIRKYWRTYLLLNVYFYGLFVVGALVASQNPDVSKILHHHLAQTMQKGWLAPVFDAYYIARNVPLAAVLTFTINLFLGSGAMLTLPSLVVPFSGLLLLSHRMILWGLLLGPKADHVAVFGTFVLEGQGYILAALAIWIHGSWVLRSKHFGFRSIRHAFTEGLKLTARFYALVAVVLLIAAIFESTAGIAASAPVFTRLTGHPSIFHSGDSSAQFSGSRVYYDPTQTPEADAKIVGVMLRDIRYFTPADTTSARISRVGKLMDIRLLLPTTDWDKEEVRTRFSKMCSELDRLFLSRKHQVTAVSVDSSGLASTRVFF